MGTLEVQAAGSRLLHCYAHGVPFEFGTPGRLLQIRGVRSANLVTAGRRPERWCLVVEPAVPVVEANAPALARLALVVARRVGCGGLQLVRHVERSDSGPAHDLYDWLKR